MNHLSATIRFLHTLRLSPKLPSPELLVITGITQVLAPLPKSPNRTNCLGLGAMRAKAAALHTGRTHRSDRESQAGWQFVEVVQGGGGDGAGKRRKSMEKDKG